jgi:hypothetical protein
MGSHNMCTHWMYQYYILYLAWWWLKELKHNTEFLILITNICCVYWLNKLLYTCWASNKICNKKIHLLHLVGILFPHIIDDARSKPHQILYTLFAHIISAPAYFAHLIFKGWFWIYFCSAYFTHHRTVHLPVISLCSDWL